MQQLISNLARVKRTVAPNTHATVLLMPSQAFMKRTLEAHPLITNDALIREVENAADVYARYYIQGTLQDPAPDGEQWSLEAALGCFESFYVLEALPQRWSPCHLFKCNCPECFRTESCMHCILASMVCNAAIRVQATCLGVTIPGRRRHGRPSARGSDVGDIPEALARERIELGKEYRLPKVSPCMLLTNFGFYLSACIQQETFVAEIIESDDDLVQPGAGAAAVGGADGRGGRGGGSVRAGGKGRRRTVLDEDNGGPGSRRSATQPEVRGVVRIW